MPVNLPAVCSGRWIAFGCFSKSKASNPPTIRLSGLCASVSYGENVPKVQTVIKAIVGLKESSPSSKLVVFNRNPLSQSWSTPFNPTSITKPQISPGLLNLGLIFVSTKPFIFHHFYRSRSYDFNQLRQICLFHFLKNCSNTIIDI